MEVSIANLRVSLVLQAFEPISQLKPCRHGLMLYNVHDVFIGWSLDQYGEWSECEVLLFRQLLQPGMVVVEAGSNIGAHTVPLARAVGPGGSVLAFEPQRLVFQMLGANLELNGITNVDCRQAAVGDAPGEAVVPALDYGKEQNFGAVAIEPLSPSVAPTYGERVPVVTIDSFGLPRCDLIKADVEGMEQQVIAAARETIGRCRPILYVENERQDRRDRLIRTIDALEYDMYWHCPPMFNPDNFAKNPVNVFPNLVSINMLCVPRDAKLTLNGFQRVEVPVSANGETAAGEM